MKELVYKNKYRINIKKGCMSCAFKIMNAGTRKCKLENNGATHPSDHLCEEWRVHPMLEDAGKGDGKVKKRRYLMTVINPSFSLKDMRLMFEAENGSIYYDM